MRIDHTTIPGAKWFVWDCERCCELRPILWIDDSIHAFARAVLPVRVIGDRIEIDVVFCRRVEIHVDKLLILVNPVSLEIQDRYVAAAVERWNTIMEASR